MNIHLSIDLFIFICHLCIYVPALYSVQQRIKMVRTVGVNEGPRVVQAKGDDVQHEGHVDGPVNAVAVHVNAGHNNITQQHHSNITPAPGETRE